MHGRTGGRTKSKGILLEVLADLKNYQVNPIKAARESETESNKIKVKHIIESNQEVLNSSSSLKLERGFN